MEQTEILFTLRNKKITTQCPDRNGLPVFADHHLVGLTSFFDHERCQHTTAEKCLELCKGNSEVTVVNILDDEIQHYLTQVLTDEYFSEFYY